MCSHGNHNNSIYVMVTSSSVTSPSSIVVCSPLDGAMATACARISTTEAPIWMKGGGRGGMKSDGRGRVKVMGGEGGVKVMGGEGGVKVMGGWSEGDGRKEWSEGDGRVE